jgi:cyclophilin family peptidyl-prolyl cis-trans isomerase
MRQFARSLWNMFRDRPRPAARRNSYARLRVRSLEDRSLPSATIMTGTLTGVAFVDSNGNGVMDAGEATLPGVVVTLSGTAAGSGKAVSTTAVTGANGVFTFQQVFPGTYHLSAGAVTGLMGGTPTFGNLTSSTGVNIVPAPQVTPGQTATQNLGYGGLAPQFISLRQFLSETDSTAFPFGAAGGGVAAASTTPTVSTSITPISVSLATSPAPQVIDLAHNFTDPGMANSQIVINTTDGPINMTLFDAQDPQTVANFYDYITSGAFTYTNSIFHRIDNLSPPGTSAPPAILQGGGFNLQDASGNVISLTNPSAAVTSVVQFGQNSQGQSLLPTVPSEFLGLPNSPGTIAMALSGSDPSNPNNPNPNSATDEFFFNLVDNTTQLNPQKFTVFGQVNGPADMAVLQKLASTKALDETGGSATSPFKELPMNNYTGTHFPTDSTAGNYIGITGITVVNRPESLTYTVSLSSNLTGLVTATVANERLTVAFTPPTAPLTVPVTGSMTVTATNQFGATVTTQAIQITVSQ